MAQKKSKEKFFRDFNDCYQNLFKLHPNEPETFRFRYLNQNWFFPHHLNEVILNVVRFKKEFFPTADLEIALFGALFHDAGLVFERETRDPFGHEYRSTKFATIVLTNLSYPPSYIEKVCKCIEATEPNCRPKSKEAFLVRNADAYTHFTTIHFFAKANFSENMEKFVSWFSQKVSDNWKKLTIRKIKKEIKPLYSCYCKMLRIYESSKEKREFIEELFEKI